MWTKSDKKKEKEKNEEQKKKKVTYTPISITKDSADGRTKEGGSKERLI